MTKPQVQESDKAQFMVRECWWFGCAGDATTFVTANDVTRAYCPVHAGRVERYYANAARWEEKTEHSHAG